MTNAMTLEIKFPPRLRYTVFLVGDKAEASRAGLGRETGTPSTSPTIQFALSFTLATMRAVSIPEICSCIPLERTG